MTPDELRAIREHVDRGGDGCELEPGCSMCIANQRALLAEVERLQVIAGECDDATLERLISNATTATEAAQYRHLLNLRRHMREHPENFR